MEFVGRINWGMSSVLVKKTSLESVVKYVSRYLITAYTYPNWKYLLSQILLLLLYWESFNFYQKWPSCQ